VRVWVHVEGDHSPLYDSEGEVVGTDSLGSLVGDLLAFLDSCQANNVFMGLVLFNGAVLRNQNTINLFSEEDKLQTYIDRALTPMVKGLKDHPALAFWEVMNEAEGSFVLHVPDSDPCFDITHLDWTRTGHLGSNWTGGVSGPGWTGADLPLRGVARVHNWIADTIHNIDPKALVSTGSWNPLASTNMAGDDPVHKTGFNHYSDNCLRTGGGREKGTLDFIQFHTYPWDGRWQLGAPWLGLTPDTYLVDGPILVGEFPSAAYEQVNGHNLPDGATTEELVEYLYTHNFAGGLSWALIPTGSEGNPEVVTDVLNGMQHLKGRTDNGNIDVNIH